MFVSNIFVCSQSDIAGFSIIPSDVLNVLILLSDTLIARLALIVVVVSNAFGFLFDILITKLFVIFSNLFDTL